MEHVKIVRSVAATESEWDHTWEDCSYSTYFHSREWSEVWSRSQQSEWSPDPRRIVFSDGQSALLVGSSRRLRVGGRVFLTAPEGTFGGWLSLDRLSSEHGRLMLRYLRTQFGLVRWRTNPRDPSIVGVCPSQASQDFTHVLELKSGYEALSSAWSKSLRYKLRKASREGVVARPAASPEDWRQYFEVYLDSRSRWGDRAVGPAYDYTILENLQKRESSNVELIVAEHDGAIVAGGLFLSSPSHAAYWHGATARSALELSPMNAVLAAAIARACDGPQREWFDFLPSSHLAGVEFYKERFHSTRVPAPYTVIAQHRVRAGNLARRLWETPAQRHGLSRR
jgi:CelD/BcsL family acetyltransferase involved in cellulose biosynthesis